MKRIFSQYIQIRPISRAVLYIIYYYVNRIGMSTNIYLHAIIYYIGTTTLCRTPKNNVIKHINEVRDLGYKELYIFFKFTNK